MNDSDPVGSGSTRLLYGNLDFESRLAEENSPGGSQELSVPAKLAISGAGTLLRVLAREGDSLWLPARIESERLTEAFGLPRPTLLAGPIDKPVAKSAILSWGAFRRTPWGSTGLGASGSGSGGAVFVGPSPAGVALWDRLWSLPPTSLRVASRVSHRRFLAEVATTLNRSLPGSRILTSMEDLEMHLREFESSGDPWQDSRGNWVLKSPLSAAGRGRCFGTGPLLSESLRRTAQRLFAGAGELLFEPWLSRTADFGSVGLCHPAGVEVLSLHGLMTDSRGRIRGLWLPSRASEPLGMRSRECIALTETTEKVGQILFGLGYVGPFGIDSWRYRTAQGEEVFHSLGEINPRMTLGLIGRILIDRFVLSRGTLSPEVRPPEGFRLWLGKPPSSESKSLVTLLCPGPTHDYGIWLEPTWGPEGALPEDETAFGSSPRGLSRSGPRRR